MRIRTIVGLVIAIVLAMSAVSVGTLVSAAPGHHDDGHHHQTKEGKKKAKSKKRAQESASAAAQASAPIGVLGTQEAPRDIAITMTDELRFEPGSIAVHEGETIRFLLENPTVTPHDFTLGDLDAQLHHNEEMATRMTHEHAAEGEGGLPGPVSLDPGETAEVMATFDEPGEVLIGCHIPGHWQAGMRGSVLVMPGGEPGAA